MVRRENRGLLQHGDVLRCAVEVGGGAAAAGGLEALGPPAATTQTPQTLATAQDHAAGALVAAALQARHHGLAGDRAELVGEGAVEDQDDHSEDPLADGGRMLQHEALVDEERTALEGTLVKDQAVYIYTVSITR